MGSHRFLFFALLLILNNNINSQEVASTEPALSVTIENENVTHISNIEVETTSTEPVTVPATIYNENITQTSSVSEESSSIEPVTVPATVDNENVTQALNITEDASSTEPVTVPAAIDNGNIAQTSIGNVTGLPLPCVSSPILGDLCVALNLTSSPRPCVNSHKADGVCILRKNCDYGTPAIDVSLYAPHGFIRPCKEVELCCPMEFIVPDPITENQEDNDMFLFDDDY